MAHISVILPIYGVEKFLPACLESLDAQTFRPFQVILVDDGSPDSSGAICDEWARKHSFGPLDVTVIHQENKGLSGARNSGIAAANGKYLAFIDSDDTVAPDYLEKLYNAITAADADIAVCGVEDVNEDGSSAVPLLLTQPDAGCFTGQELLDAFYAPNGQAYTVAWNKLYKADLWKNLRYPLGKIHEDDAVAHRLYLDCKKVVCLPDVLYFYRMRQGSICRTGVNPNKFDGVVALIDRYHCLREHKLPPEKTAHACWKNYLFLCGQAAQAPTAALAERIAALQPDMRNIPTVGLTLMEKLSARRWSRNNPSALLGLNKK